jgi:hypothetical protein
MKRHEDLIVGDGNSPPFADPLQERQEPALKRQIHHTASWPPDRWRGPAEGVLPAQWPEPQFRTRDLRAAGRNRAGERTSLERVCSISRGPCCGTLLTL